MVFSLNMLKRNPRTTWEFKHLRKFSEANRKKKYWDDQLGKLNRDEDPEKYQRAFLNSNYWEIVMEDEAQYIEHLFDVGDGNDGEGN